MKFSQRRVARPMIARHGGTHLVDLAVSDPSGGNAERGKMEQVSSYDDDNGDTCTTYRPSLNDTSQRDRNRSAMAWPFGRAGGAGELMVTEVRRTDDEAYRTEDVQPEPGEADGEEQNADGAQTDQDDSKRATVIRASYRKRSGGIG